jgi:glycosylphosphatidylinositol transamidase
MIAFALLVAPLPMVAASLYVNASNSDESMNSEKSSPSATAVDSASSPTTTDSAPLVTASECTPLLTAADSGSLATVADSAPLATAAESAPLATAADSAPLATAADSSRFATTADCITLSSWKWLYAAKKSFIVYLWGSVVSLLPYFICQIPSCTPTTSFIIWVLLSILGLVVMYGILASPFSDANDSKSQKEWAILKSVTLSAAFIGLCLMSIINFATAEIGGLLMVPMCLMAHPLKLDVQTRSLRTISRAVCNLVLGFIGFPPVTFIVLKGGFEGFSSISVGDFWSWVESLWAWNSATYLYIGVVHLPCWVLCIHILFHHC